MISEGRVCQSKLCNLINLSEMSSTTFTSESLRAFFSSEGDILKMWEGDPLEQKISGNSKILWEIMVAATFSFLCPKAGTAVFFQRIFAWNECQKARQTGDNLYVLLRQQFAACWRNPEAFSKSLHIHQSVIVGDHENNLLSNLPNQFLQHQSWFNS